MSVMSFKKNLSIISIIIVVVFSMMLTTSYAWYSFETASTTFSGVTNNDDIIVSFQKGEYINTTNAIPIASNQVDKYSEKNQFNVKVRNNVKDNVISVSISLVDIEMDSSLKNSNFRIDLYYQGKKIIEKSGTSIGASTTTLKLADVVLSTDINNNFELRLYILDSGTQNSLMGKTFSAKIKVDVASRLKHTYTDYSNSDIRITDVTIDGIESMYIPTEGFYEMSATCSKGSNLSWEPLSKTIIYNSGSYINDDCSLSFTTSSDYPLLNDMPVGSYVKYVGSNGCAGKACEGYNANYVNDNDMGYCGNTLYKFHVNGWRIAYVKNGSTHLVSAGSTECICTNALGVTSNTSCSNSLIKEEIDVHLNNLNIAALKYCNVKYANGGMCDLNTAWSINGDDFKYITGSVISSCGSKSSSVPCGWQNNLIDNGSYYWFAKKASSGYPNNWSPTARYVDGSFSGHFRGLRPVLKLDPSVVVIAGNGTYKNPYIISII